jgi:hypothetical protein
MQKGGMLEIAFIRRQLRLLASDRHPQQRINDPVHDLDAKTKASPINGVNNRS